MERNEISKHEVLVYRALRTNAERWLSNHEIAALAPEVAPRTIRAHTRRLVQAGVVDQQEVFPGHRYRWAEKADRRNGGYLQRLQMAASVFGLS